MIRSPFVHRLLLLALMAGAGHPVQAAEGNAPALALPEGLLARGLEAGPGLIRAPLAQIRRALHAPMVPIDAGAKVEVVSSTGTVALDFTGLEVQSSSTLVVKSQTYALYEVYLYLDIFPSGNLVVTDPEGPLGVSSLPYDMVAVTLRAPLSLGESVALTVTQSGIPTCKPKSLGVQTCLVSPSLIYDISLGWQPLVVDAALGTIVNPAQSSLAVTVPASMAVATTGLPAGAASNPDGTTTYSFTGTTEGMFSVAAGAYTTGSTPFGAGQEARSFFLGSHAAQGAAWRQAALEVLAFHAERYGPYDLGKIDLVEVSDSAGAAFGPLSAVFMPGTLLGYDPSLWSTRATLAHELGHQWFGGFIQSVDYYSPWLSEGFATFAEMEYTIAAASKAQGASYGPTYRTLVGQQYIYGVRAGTDVPMTSEAIYKVPGEIYVVVTYSKGGLVVNMLRHLLGGDAPFFAALKQYRADHQEQGATAASLQASLEGASGKELGCFFTRWVQSAGYPTFSVGVKRAPAAGPHRVELTVTADKEPCLPLEVELRTADGQTRRETLTLAGVQATATFDTAAEVLQVTVDPDRQVVGRVLGALPGDIQLNGEVDGIDLIYAAWAQGQTFKYAHHGMSYFPDFADLIFDGSTDGRDLDVVLGSFGKTSGQGG